MINLFNEPMIDEFDSSKNSKSKNLKQVDGQKVEKLITASMCDLSKLPYPAFNYLDNIKNIYDENKSHIDKTSQKIIDYLHSIDEYIIGIEKSPNCPETNTKLWYPQKNCEPKTDIIWKTQKRDLKVSIKKGKDFQISSPQISKKDNDLLYTLDIIYPNEKWVKNIKQILSPIYMGKFDDLYNFKGHTDGLKKRFPDEYTKLTCIHDNLTKELNRNIDIDTKEGKEFIMSFVNGNLKFGKDTTYSANSYLTVDLDKCNFKFYNNDDELWDYLIHENIKHSCSFKTSSGSHPNSSYRILVSKK